MARVAGALEIQMFAGIQRLQKDMNDARGVVNRTARSIESAAAMATRALGALGLGIGLVGLGRMVKGALEAQDALSKLSQKLNVTVETLVGYQHAAQLAGVSNEALTKGFKSLSTQMFDASMGLLESKRNFAALGVEIMKSDGTLKNIDSVMLEVADTFAKMENGTAKTALAVKLFGKAGMDMIPMLNEGSAAIAAMVAEGQRLNPVTTESARQAEIFNDNLSRVADSAKTASIALLNKLLPAMAAISQEMAKAATMPGGGFWAALLTGAQTALTGDDTLKNLQERAKLAGQIATAQRVIEINTKSFGDEDRRTIAAKEQLTILRGRMETAMAYYKVLQQGAKQEAEADALRKAVKEKITLENDTANNKAAADAKKLRDADIKGWIAHADAVFAAADEENLELAKLADEHWKNEEKLREEDIKGWIAYADAVFAEADENNLELARINGEYWKKVEDARKKENEERLREQKRVSDEIDRMLGDAIMRGFERGEDAAKNFRDTLVNMFKTLVLRPIVSYVMSPVTGAISTAASGLGLSNTVSAAGNIAGLAGTGASMTSLIGANAVGMAGGDAMGALIAGNAGTWGVGASGVTGAAGMMGTIGTAIPYVGMALAAAYALGMFDSDERTASAQATGLSGKLSRSGLVGQQWTGMGDQGDWWAGTQFDALPADSVAQANIAISAVFKNMEEQANALHLSTAALAGITVDAVGTGQGVQADFAASLAKTADTIAEKLMPNIRAFQQQGESLAQTFERLAVKRRSMEIELMELTGKEVEALAAKREDELKALPPVLHALQKQIYAAQDLADAANDASSAVSTLAELLSETQSAVNEQIGASRSASQAARAAAESFRQIGIALADAVTKISGGGKAGAAGRLDALFGVAMTGNAAALSALPQAGQDFLAASMSSARTSLDFARDQAKVVAMLNKAQAITEGMVNWNEYQATLLEAQTGVLESIRDQLEMPSPDSAILTQQMEMLSTISGLLQDQTTQIVSGNGMQALLMQDQTGKIVLANTLTTDQTGQVILGNSWLSQQAALLAAANTIVNEQTGTLLAGSYAVRDNVGALTNVTIGQTGQIVSATGAQTGSLLAGKYSVIDPQTGQLVGLTVSQSGIITASNSLLTAANMGQGIIQSLLNGQTAQVIDGNLVLKNQSGLIIASNAILKDQAGKLTIGNSLVGTQTAKIITGNATQDVIKNITALNTSYSEQQLAALVESGGLQAGSLQAIVLGNSAIVSLLQQLISLQGQVSAEQVTSGMTWEEKFQAYAKTLYDSMKVPGETFDLGAFDAAMAAWRLSNPMPSYAVGTSFVPATGPAMLHQGERVMTAAANDELVTEIRRLNDKIDRMRSDTKKSADTLEAVANGQLSFSTEAA